MPKMAQVLDIAVYRVTQASAKRLNEKQKGSKRREIRLSAQVYKYLWSNIERWEKEIKFCTGREVTSLLADSRRVTRAFELFLGVTVQLSLRISTTDLGKQKNGRNASTQHLHNANLLRGTRSWIKSALGSI